MKIGCLGTTQSKSENPERQSNEKKKMLVLSIHTFNICCISIYYKHTNKTVLILTSFLTSAGR